MLFIRHGVIVKSEGGQIIKNIVSNEKLLKSWQTTIVVNEESSNKLKEVLVNYLDILSKSRVRSQIIKSFNFKIPVAYIRLYDKKTKRRTRFIEILREFFFVGEAYFYL